MALTNVFLNSYKQPENKLTYNFLCLLEHMPQQHQFCEFLTDGRIKLASNPIEEIQTVFSGKASNPDGAFVLSNVHGKIAGLLNTISANFDFGKFGIKNASSEIEDRWGRNGLVITFESQKDYGQWMFFGIYHDESDHLIPFKHSGIPELAFFLDIEPTKRENLKSVKGIEADVADLRRQGFDDNLFSKLTSNNWRFLAKRKSLTDVSGLTEAALSDFLTNALQSLKEKPIIWREIF